MSAQYEVQRPSQLHPKQHLADFLGAVCECLGLVVEYVTTGKLIDAAREAEQARQYTIDATDVAGRI